ncbi:hypothetical protein MishRS11D_29340 [Methylomagnum ishizawai]|nr:hypothetical protein MishRS11D_29340 [Methylomagnum ishizawai]
MHRELGGNWLGTVGAAEPVDGSPSPWVYPTAPRRDAQAPWAWMRPILGGGHGIAPLPHPKAQSAPRRKYMETSAPGCEVPSIIDQSAGGAPQRTKASNTPAATADPITPATFGPMACINRKLCGLLS